MNDRLRNAQLQKKIVSAGDAAGMIRNGSTIATSGFTPSGYPKAVPLELVKRVKEHGEDVHIGLFTGASTGEELDESLAAAGIVTRRLPYQTSGTMRKRINDGNIQYIDMHLSHSPQFVSYGFLDKIDIAIIEASAITEDGHIVPTTSVGSSPTFVKYADKVIIELNENQPLSLEGMHDIFIPGNPPNRDPIGILHTGDRIGKTYIECGMDKIACIVMTDMKDNVRPFAPITRNHELIAHNLIAFFEYEIKKGRLPQKMLPLQSGVGSVANAVLGGLVKSKFSQLEFYSEVIQDSVFELLDAGIFAIASATALSPSKEGFKRFFDEIVRYRDRIILRPQEISNNPEVIRRLGIISMNTAIEMDIYGNVNSTHIMGSEMMNGIGGSGDFTRNAYLSIFSTESTAKNGTISSIVPMVSHHDHTEHDVDVVVTEQGLADLRGLSPRERAAVIIDNCAHPDYRDRLRDYYHRAVAARGGQTPVLLEEALSWHSAYLRNGRM